MVATNIWDARYKVFISYSHADEEAAKWLEERLEAWQTPRKLVGAWTPNGPIPKDLKPVFRDRSTLAAESDLTAALRERLEQSATMVVICSPNVCRQRAEGERNWIDDEIRHFRSKGGAGRVFAYIVDGTPNSGGETECFPPALLELEPAAADARPDKDTKEGAFIKLVAGVLGCDPTDLAEKENQALRDRARNARFIAAGFGALALLAVGFAGWGINRAYQAERNLALAREAVNTIAGLLDDNELGAQSGFAPFAGQLTEALIPFYENFSRVGNSSATRIDMVRARILAGRMENRRGDLGAAIEHYEAAVAMSEPLARRPNANADARSSYLRASGYLLYALLDTGDLQGATALNERTLETNVTTTQSDGIDAVLQQNLLLGSRARLARFKNDRATAVRIGEEIVRAARQNVAEEPANIQARRDLSIGLIDLSYDLKGLRRMEPAQAALREGCDVADATLRLAPEHIFVLSDSLHCRIDEGQANTERGQYDNAMAILDEAANDFADLIDRNPGIANLHLGLARVHYSRASVATWRGDGQEQMRYARLALEQFGQFADSMQRAPSSPSSFYDYYSSLAGGISTAYTTDNAAQLAQYDWFLSRFSSLIERYPDIPVFAETLGTARFQAALLRERISRDSLMAGADPAELATAFAEAATLLARAREGGFYGGVEDQETALCTAHNNAAKQHLRAENGEEAQRHVTAALAVCRPLYERDDWDFYAMEQVISSHRIQGDIHKFYRRGAQARDSYLAAEALRPASAAEELATLYTDGRALTANAAEATRWRGLAAQSGMKRFTVPVGPPGSPNRTPFHVYVVDWGPNYPYEGIESQAIWLERRRNLVVPNDVRESFIRLHRIARENDVSFEDLSVYALGMAQPEQ